MKKGYQFEFPLLLFLDGKESEQQTIILHVPLSTSADGRTTIKKKQEIPWRTESRKEIRVTA
jgi:hypothetical protein